jgi:hypothetical protein
MRMWCLGDAAPTVSTLHTYAVISSSAMDMVTSSTSMYFTYSCVRMARVVLAQCVGVPVAISDPGHAAREKLCCW